MTDFFIRKKYLIALFFTGVLFLSAIFYANFLKNAVVVSTNVKFYFLIDTQYSVPVATEVSRLKGGAGYLLNGEYVVHSCYTENQTAEKLADRESGVRVLEITSKELCFDSVLEKKNRKTVVGSLNTLYACIKVLNQCIYRLDDGATQESVKRVLKDVQKVLCSLENSCKKTFRGMSDLCAKASALIEKSVDGIVYGKDLRYVSCMLCDGYLSLCQNFRI